MYYFRFLRVVNTEAVGFVDNPDHEWSVQVLMSNDHFNFSSSPFFLLSMAMRNHLTIYFNSTLFSKIGLSSVKENL